MQRQVDTLEQRLRAVEQRPAARLYSKARQAARRVLGG
jgi:hypothetical protein